MKPFEVGTRRPAAAVALVVVVALATAACAGGSDADQPAASSTTTAQETVAPQSTSVPQATAPAESEGAEPDVPSENATDFDPFVFTANVDITEDGYEPESLYIPAGRIVQLVIRNRTASEHHYRVLGMETSELVWISVPPAVWEEGVSEEEHLLHHIPGFVEWRGTSPQGIKPSLEEVHAYASGNELDVVRFTATSLGTFAVVDPLHSEFAGSVTVFD